MRCEVCGLGPMEGVTVFRANEKGIKGVWRCRKHHCSESLESAAKTQHITDALEGKETRQ